MSPLSHGCMLMQSPTVCTRCQKMSMSHMFWKLDMKIKWRIISIRGQRRKEGRSRQDVLKNKHVAVAHVVWHWAELEMTNKFFYKVKLSIDNCTIAISTSHLVEDFKADICKHVKVTNLGKLHWMLGLEIKHNQKDGTIHILQHALSLPLQWL